jgi:hypothetical protein
MMKKIRVILIGGQSNAVGCTKKDTLDEKYRGVGNCVLGYAEGDIPAPKPRKENYIVRP